jgi:hypothetical protein
MLILRSLAVAATVGLAVVACNSDDPTMNGTGTVVVKLTDAPFPFDSVEKVEVFVVRVDAKQVDVSEAEADEGTDDASEDKGGWQTIAEPNKVIDLLTLRDGKTTNLGQDALPEGTWRAFRLIIDPAQSKITLKDGSNPSIVWPSAARSGLKVQMPAPVELEEGESVEVTIDFDVGESFVLRGNSIKNNGLLFKPVIKAKVVTPAPSAP